MDNSIKCLHCERMLRKDNYLVCNVCHSKNINRFGYMYRNSPEYLEVKDFLHYESNNKTLRSHLTVGKRRVSYNNKPIVIKLEV